MDARLKMSEDAALKMSQKEKNRLLEANTRTLSRMIIYVNAAILSLTWGIAFGEHTAHFAGLETSKQAMLSEWATRILICGVVSLSLNWFRYGAVHVAIRRAAPASSGLVFRNDLFFKGAYACLYAALLATLLNSVVWIWWVNQIAN